MPIRFLQGFNTFPSKAVLGLTLAALLMTTAHPGWAKETYPAELTQTCQDNGLEPDLPAINGNDECLGCHATNNKVVNEPNAKGDRYKLYRSNLDTFLTRLLDEFCVAPTEDPPPPDQPEAGDGACGYADDSDYSSEPTDPLELCASGSPSSVVSKDDRFEWFCNGTTDGAGSQVCYTLSANGKRNQDDLTLLPGSTTVPSGKAVKLKTTGGSGKGKIKYRRLETSGTKCRLAQTGKKARLKVKGAGICKIMATKAGDKNYNEVQSAPITVTVTP
jgi:hypothetical protein